MPSRVALRVVVLALAVLALPLSVATATHSPTVADVTAAASSLGMVCQAFATEVDCTGPAQYSFRNPSAVIHPGSGPLVDVVSKVDPHVNGAHELSPEDQGWMTTLHAVGCANQNGVAVFLRDLNAMFANAASGGSYGPLVVGECQLVGSFVMSGRVCQPPDCYFTVKSTILGSAFPTPPPTPRPTPVPTPRIVPTPVPTPIPTPTPSPTPTATPSPSPTATPKATTTPEQSVAGITFAPQASPLAGAPAEPGAGSGGGGGWADTVPLASQASRDPSTIGVSALMALLLLILLGFAAEIFNNTLEAHYDVIAGWIKKIGIPGIGKAP